MRISRTGRVSASLLWVRITAIMVRVVKLACFSVLESIPRLSIIFVSAGMCSGLVNMTATLSFPGIQIGLITFDSTSSRM